LNKFESIHGYEHPYVTTDAVVFSVQSSEPSSYRKLPEMKLRVLLYKREEEPFRDKWCLPGGFLNIDELPEINIRRKLSEKSAVSNCWLEQLYTFCDVERDPRDRVISIAYLGLMKEEAANTLNGNSRWFVIQDCTDAGIRMCGRDVEITHKDIAFDHSRIIQTALSRMQGKIWYTDIAFNLLPAEFTLTQIQNVYEAILGMEYQPANFRRKIVDMVQETDRRTTDAGHRPAKIFIKKEIKT